MEKKKKIRVIWIFYYFKQLEKHFHQTFCQPDNPGAEN
jgi:hypothetical protein